MSYEEPYCDVECFGCAEKDNQLEDVRYWLTSVLEHLYGIVDYDEPNLEHSLDELAQIVGLKLPLHNLNIIRRSESKVFNLGHAIDNWKQLNNNYIQSSK